MISEPKLEDRKEQRYVAIRSQIMMSEVSTALPPLIGEMFGWLASKGIQPVGAPFFRYVTIDLVNKMNMEVGVSVATPVNSDGRVITGILPAGRYATVLYTGPYDGVNGAHQVLLEWGAKKGIVWDKWIVGTGEGWAAFIEVYPTDPAVEPNPEKWQTEVAFKLADEQPR